MAQTSQSTYTYSARGTRTGSTDASGSHTAAFDALGRMVSADGTTYAYDALGRLVKQGTQTLTYADQSNNPVSGGGQLLFRGPSGEALSSANTDGTGAAALLSDLHDDVTGSFAPATGTLGGSTGYSPFGQITAQTGTTSALGYQGEYTDPDTGQVNMHARWYDPTTGGFSSRDSWTLNPVPSIQANRYTYGNGSPLTNTDPSGHFVPLVLGGIALGDALLGLGAATAVTTAVVGGTQYVADNWESSSGSRSASSSSRGWSNSPNSVAAAATAIYAASLAATAVSTYVSAGCYSGCRGPHGDGSGHGPRSDNGTGSRNPWGGPRSPWTPRGPTRGPQKPPTPPPPPWATLIKLALSKVTPRPTTESEADTEHKRYVDDSFTRAQKDLKLTEELAKYIKYFPGLGSLIDVTIDPFLSSAPELGRNPGQGPGTQSDDGECDASPTVDGNRTYFGLEGFVDADGNKQCRATGAFAMLQPSDLTKRGTCWKCETGSYEPPGMDEVRAQDLGRADIGHLLPYAAAGSGHDPKNLVPLFRETNQYDMNWGPEREVRKALKAGRSVAVAVQPIYLSVNSGVPSTINYTFVEFNHGMEVSSTTCIIRNRAARYGTTC